MLNVEPPYPKLELTKMGDLCKTHSRIDTVASGLGKDCFRRRKSLLTSNDNLFENVTDSSHFEASSETDNLNALALHCRLLRFSKLHLDPLAETVLSVGGLQAKF